MDNFMVIYKILSALEKAMDYDRVDICSISAEKFGISVNRLIRIWKMLAGEGYVDGISVKQSVGDDIVVLLSNPGITLKGLEYLAENPFMKKAANIAKGIKDTIPGL